MIILELIGTLVGGGLLGSVIMHYIQKSKYNSEVKGQDANNESISQLTYSRLIQDVTVMLKEERELRKEQESECEKKIGELRKQMDELQELVKQAKNRCIANCFLNEKNRQNGQAKN
jgi:prephenate dehydrogenase